MTTRRSDIESAGRCLRLSRAAAVALSALTLTLSACSDGKKGKVESQTAVRVNKEEVTVHQINQLLQQRRGLRPDQVDAASTQVLELLVDQELAVQRTRELKIDQDPAVMLQVDTAKREVLARAYAEKTGNAARKPSAEEVKKYFDDRPSLFSERRIYNIQELAIEARPEQVAPLRDELKRAKSAAEFVQYVKANNLRFKGDQGIRPAEQLPANVLDSLTTMTDGQMVLLPAPLGAVVILLVSSRAEPLDEARAKPVIEQLLLNDAKRKLVDADIKALRASAKIEYIGKFAEAAASAAPASASTPGPVAAMAPVAAASGMSAEDIGKGMGIKK